MLWVCPVENWTVCSDDRLRFYYQDLRRIYNSFKKSLDPANRLLFQGESGDAHKNAGP